MINQNRRNILGVLGLAGAAAATMSTEAVAEGVNRASNLDPHFPSLDTGGPERQIAIAESLENIAKHLRLGIERSQKHLPGEQLHAKEIRVVSTMGLDDWLRHDITISLEFYGEDKTS